MVSDSTPRRPILTLDELAQPLTRRPERLYALTAAELLIAFSRALDLAEGKDAGHAQRVCYIATHLADALGFDDGQRSAVYFGALLHDAGVTAASADLFRAAGVDEMSIFGPSPLPERNQHNSLFADRTAIDHAVRSHAAAGAAVARDLELGDDVARAIEQHHERWDGGGYPHALAGDDIDPAARIIAAADLAEVLIAGESNALVARRRFATDIGEFAGNALDPAAVEALFALGRNDAFWLGLYGEDLAATLNAMRGPVDARRSRKRLVRYAEVFAALADNKRGHGSRHARVTAEHAVRLAEAIELEPATVELVRIAALLLDIGLLGVPARVMSKPDILSVTEMQLMRQHPLNSELVLEDLAGFEEVSRWIARHHERPDGKGYPDMADGDDIPLESRILAVADVYAALASDRPHRAALAAADVRQVMLNAAGTQLDPELVRTLLAIA